MYFDLISVGTANDQAVIRFHPRMTVIGGMQAPEREQFARMLVETVAGTSTEVATARWVDLSGAGIQRYLDAGVWRWCDDDGNFVDDLRAVYGLDETTLGRLMILSATDLAAARSGPDRSEQPELVDARTTLAALERELTDAMAMQSRVDALRAKVAALDERIRTADVDAARRRYARLVRHLEQVRIEATSLRGGAQVAEADRRFVADSGDVRALVEQWRQTRQAAKAERQRFGTRERLDPRTLADALASPDQVPPELDGLAAAYEAAEAERGQLVERLNALASGALPEPSHPAVIRLAHADQDEVWEAARRAIAAGRKLEDQSLALGGIEAEGVAPAAATDLETAHDRVDLALREVHRRRVPGIAGGVVGLLFALLGLVVMPVLAGLGLLVVGASALWAIVIPTRDLQRRRAEEAAALENAGVASYITLQLRRLEVHIEPKATEPLELAALEYRRELARWRKLAGDLAPTEALALEAETRAYVEALAGSRDTADEIAQIRDELAAKAEPKLAGARARLVEACAPFGIDDPRLAVDLVRHQAETSTHARAQAALEDAEGREAEAWKAVDERLSALGFPGSPSPDDADVERRVSAFERARGEAEARERARTEARPAEDVEAELAQLEAQVAAQARPEWTDVVDLTDEPEVDLETLRAERDEAAAELRTASRGLPDVERLSDRREAMERRVAVLAGIADGTDTVDTTDLEQVLLARLAAARRVGPRGESVTVILDEPFETIHGDRKRSILDAAERLSGSVQLVYLTDDVEVLVWARHRADGGSVRLLEPTPEPEREPA